jgi:hypothetical protein
MVILIALALGVIGVGYFIGSDDVVPKKKIKPKKKPAFFNTISKQGFNVSESQGFNHSTLLDSSPLSELSISCIAD